MRNYEVWFAIPSASLERCRKVLPVWRQKGYKIAILQNQERGEVPADIVQWSDTYPGWAQSINILSKQIVPKSADIIVSGGCDMLPDPNHTAQQLAEQFYKRFPDGFGVMQPHGDEFMEAKHYCGSPFLGRKWIDTMYQGTGPMYGRYRHNWADNELFWVAKCLDALWSRPDLSHFHEHFNRDPNGKKPVWWTANVEGHDRQDVELFLSRQWLRFPGHEPLGVSRQFDARAIFENPGKIAEKHYERYYGRTAMQAMEDTLKYCAERGLKSVALYDDGGHAARMGTVLMHPPVDIKCIIDDEPSRQGGKLWGFPIVSRTEALLRGIDAVVLSSDWIEGRLWDNSAIFAEKGLPVLRLYDPNMQEKNQRVASAIQQCAAAGKRRIALYGAGAHTRELKECLTDLQRRFGVELVCVFDDAPDAGAKLHGVPVVPLAQAEKIRPDAIILSSNRAEPRMWEKTASLRAAGIDVIRLYDKPGAGAGLKPLAMAS